MRELRVETKYIVLDKKPFVLENGEKLESVTVAYETYGELNSKKSNAILVEHAFSGDAHAAGYHAGDKKPGWWDNIIGPDKAIDTNKFFVICANVLGGCKGTTGPVSINPETGKHYGMSFPLITIADMVCVQKELTDYLGIKKLVSVIGGSMGGMQVLQWVSSYPESLRSAIPIATTMKHSPQQIAFNEVARQSIMADPDWNNGDYYDTKSPILGLSIARMIGHITYMSDNSMESKFSRRKKQNVHSFEHNFEVENYLHRKGDDFVKRFDANSYLYITKAMDYFDVSGNLFDAQSKLADMKFLVIAFESDWLYPIYQSLDIIKELRKRHIPVTYCGINSTYGHDAFLLEEEEETKLMKPFLNSINIDGE